MKNQIQRLIVLLALTSCSGASFQGSNRKTVGKKNENAAPKPVTGGSQVENPGSDSPAENLKLQQEIDIVVNDLTQPVDLVVIADDSSSMKSNQALLAESLKKTFKSLKGKEINVRLFSSSQLARATIVGNTYINYTSMPVPGTSSFMTFTGVNLPDYFFSNSKFPSTTHETSVYKNGVATAFSSRLSEVPDYLVSYTRVAPSAFSTPDRALHFNASLSDAEFAARVETLTREIVIGESGAAEELPLCTLATILMNEGSNAFLSSASRFAALIIGDEDQADKKCLSHMTKTSLKGPTSKYGGYKLNATVIDIEYSIPLDNAGSGNGARKTSDAISRLDCKTDPLCEASRGFANVTYTCSPAQRAEVVQWFQNKYQSQIAAGKVLFDPATAVCTAKNYVRDPRINISVPLNYEADQAISGHANFRALHEASYPNTLFDFSNPGFAYSAGTFENEFKPYPGLSDSYTNAELVTWIRNKATATFGRDNFLISAIVNVGSKNPSNCSLDAAKPSQYILGVADVATSICAEDYTENLKWLNNFVSKQLQRTYTVKQKIPQGALLQLISDAQTITLQPSDYVYNEAAMTLEIKITPPDLNAHWVLHILEKNP